MNQRSTEKQAEQAEIDAAKAAWFKQGNKPKQVDGTSEMGYMTTTEKQKAKTFRDVIDGLSF